MTTRGCVALANTSLALCEGNACMLESLVLCGNFHLRYQMQQQVAILDGVGTGLLTWKYVDTCFSPCLPECRCCWCNPKSNGHNFYSLILRTVAFVTCLRSRVPMTPCLRVVKGLYVFIQAVL